MQNRLFLYKRTPEGKLVLSETTLISQTVCDEGLELSESATVFTPPSIEVTFGSSPAAPEETQEPLLRVYLLDSPQRAVAVPEEDA